MKKNSENKNICDHFPMLGMNADFNHGGCWKILTATMREITRQCVKCGQIEVSQLASYNTEMFMSEGRKYQLNKDRDDNAINTIQPIDSKTGKFNEDFGKHYGYNPMKTPAPQLQNKPDDLVDNIMSGKVEEKLKLKKL